MTTALDSMYRQIYRECQAQYRRYFVATPEDFNRECAEILSGGETVPTKVDWVMAALQVVEKAHADSEFIEQLAERYQPGNS